MKKKVLVTGGHGPLGRYVIEALADHGELVVSTEANAELPRLLDLLREHCVDRIVHAADASNPRISIELPVATVAANVEGTLHLLEAARVAGIVGRVVLLSSNVVYGHNPEPIDESAPLHPRTPYAVAKVTGEQLAAIYADLYGLDVAVLRLGEGYGPQLALPTVLRRLIASAARGEPFRSASGAEHAFHLTHGEDICRAVIDALAAAEPMQRVYNVTGGERHTLAEIAALVRERLPLSRIDLGPGHLPGLDRQGPLDIRAADRELGYRPRWGLARGIDDYIEWLLAEREAA